MNQILDQRQAKAAVGTGEMSAKIEPAAAAEPVAPVAKTKATRNRKPEPGSKRSSWKMRAWYVQPETASRLRAYVNRQQEAGEDIDASDVVDQALAAWLNRKGA